MDREYQRLLDRDKQPLAFLYKGIIVDIVHDFPSTYPFQTFVGDGEPTNRSTSSQS